MFGNKGKSIVDNNNKVIDLIMGEKTSKKDFFYKLNIKGLEINGVEERPLIPAHKMKSYEKFPEGFLDKVVIPCMKMEGDNIPVSMMSFDGAIPTGTSQLDVKIGYDEIPVWNKTTCIECTFCSIVCPHNAIFSKQIPEEEIKKSSVLADISFPKEIQSKHFDFHANEKYINENRLISNGICLPYHPDAKKKATHLRKNMTESEKKIRYDLLKNRDEQWNRQKPIDHFIADFYCEKYNLIIEIDGSVHDSEDVKGYDKRRTEILELYGLKVIRFTNNEVLYDLNLVADKLNNLLASFGKGGAEGGGLNKLPFPTIVKEIDGKKYHFRIQINPEQCTGCGLCVDNCPMKNSALTMKLRKDVDVAQEQKNFEMFDKLPGTKVGYTPGMIQHSQLGQSYFLYSGACSGCGETPVIKLLTQLFGPHLLIANATGCSSIYGGTFPNIPWVTDQKGNGPAWANSLFEDNAEFGLGIHLAKKNKTDETLRIIGGDGWAYDIGFGGLDHVVATGENVNILILDTQGYANTGGQCSKATPKGAKAIFAKTGKKAGKKDLGKMLIQYESVYVASINLGANNFQAIQALQEAVNYDGPSVIIAYSTCVAHGIDMSKGNQLAKDAVNSGFRPMYRYNPNLAEQGKDPMQWDGPRDGDEGKIEEFKKKEKRFG